MPDNTVDPNLEPIRFRIEDSTPEPLNNETSADPSLEPVADDVFAQSIFEFDSSPIVELVCESPVLDFDSSTRDGVFTSCSSGSELCLSFLDPQQSIS
jgi:hypothetical protein